MTNIKHRTTKDPLPLFFLDLKPNADNNLIYNINYLQNTKIAKKPPGKKHEIPQRTRRQSYYHTKSYCFKPYRCVKCGGQHDSAKCSKPKSTPAICANSEGDHPANYKGCTIYKDLQKMRGKPMFKAEFNNNRENISLQTQTEHTSVPRHPSPPPSPRQTNPK